MVWACGRWRSEAALLLLLLLLVVWVVVAWPTGKRVRARGSWACDVEDRVAVPYPLPLVECDLIDPVFFLRGHMHALPLLGSRRGWRWW